MESGNMYFKFSELVTISELCKNPPVYLTRVTGDNERLIISKNGRPVCAVVPLSSLSNPLTEIGLRTTVTKRRK